MGILKTTSAGKTYVIHRDGRAEYVSGPGDGCGVFLVLGAIVVPVILIGVFVRSVLEDIADQLRLIAGAMFASPLDDWARFASGWLILLVVICALASSATTMIKGSKLMGG